ncbi:MAG: TrkH family potassium uptake protein [Proteobacteria bacterium]|nr:TrkH family potassium uptake protein [Pseudomonadota bacterium]
MREKDALRLHYAAILSYTGVILLISGLAMLAPLLVLVMDHEGTGYAPGFVLPSLCLTLLGLLLWWLFRSASRTTTLSTQEGGIIVLLSWLVVILFSAWPFVSLCGLTFSRALFESVSGWTTTGLSVVDLSKTVPVILFWRSEIQLLGGAGLAIIMMSAIVAPTGTGISSAEGRSDQLAPHVRQSARLVLIIYSCYAAIGTLSYWLAGMSPFDAVNHAFAAVSTGGFSTKVSSIGQWDSVVMEAVTLPLMILGNLSFVTAWFLWRGKIRAVVRNGEVRLLAMLLPLSAASLFLLTSRTVYPKLAQSIRVAVFETVSALTTTGFSITHYGNWPASGLFLLVILMLIGGGTCSTAGGIKQYRIYLLGKVVLWDIKRYFLPRTAILERPVWEGNRRIFIDDAKIRQISVFVFLYLATWAFGVLLLTIAGFSLADSLFEFTSAIGTVGLSVGVTSSRMPDSALWAEIVAMFLGRLEFIVVITSLLKIGRDIHLMAGKSFLKK